MKTRLTSRFTARHVVAFVAATLLASAATAITVQSSDAARAAEMGVEAPAIADLLDSTP